jgi:hypothetical protein
VNGTASPFGVFIATGLAGLLAAAITGCGTAGTASRVVNAASPSHSTALPSASATPVVLDAKKLNSELLPARDMPKGYAVDAPVTRYDNAALPGHSSSPVSASQFCPALAQTSWIRVVGFETPDFAEASFVNSSNTEEISEQIDAFQGGDAQKAMTLLWKAFGRCATFTESSSGVTAKMTVSRSKLDGQLAGIKSVQVSPAYIGGDTLVAIRAGYSVVTIFDSTEASDDGSAAISMAERIARRLSAAETSK